jgi:peptidoglycan hydrolase CwlO-like protein
MIRLTKRELHDQIYELEDTHLHDVDIYQAAQKEIEDLQKQVRELNAEREELQEAYEGAKKTIARLSNRINQ